jgi:chemotaxis regulatin CheY-phosphate phosphatase CheZ
VGQYASTIARTHQKDHKDHIRARAKRVKNGPRTATKMKLTHILLNQKQNAITIQLVKDLRKQVAIAEKEHLKAVRNITKTKKAALSALNKLHKLSPTQARFAVANFNIH